MIFIVLVAIACLLYYVLLWLFAIWCCCCCVDIIIAIEVEVVCKHLLHATLNVSMCKHLRDLFCCTECGVNTNSSCCVNSSLSHSSFCIHTYRCMYVCLFLVHFFGNQAMISSSKIAASFCGKAFSWWLLFSLFVCWS